VRRLALIATLVVATAAIVVLGTGASEDRSGDYQVRVIFDNAFSIIEGEDVRVSGVNIGKIKELDVTKDNKAAAVLEIFDKNFQDFRQDAKCAIRPQSLIGEKFVECTLTEPRPEGEAAPPALEKIADGEDGAGQYLLPVERTSKPVDTDLINNVMRLPQRQRLAVIINELGGAVAGRSEDLNETIRRANPALGATNEVLKILAEQNKVLEDLATDSDAVLAPLARDRDRVTSFIENANSVSRATAERRTEFERNFELLPRFLEELRPTMTRLGELSDEMSPVLEDLQSVAPDINRFFEALGPFSSASIPAFESLGEAAEVGGPALVASKPIIDDIRRLTDEAEPLADNLAGFATSLRDTGGIERFLDYLFYQVAAVNGYDAFGHYLRAGLIVNTCSTYATNPAPGCTAKWPTQEPDARAASMGPANVRRAFASRAPGADHSAEALTGSTPRRGKEAPKQGDGGSRRNAPALKLPSAMLPGEDSTQPAQGRGQAAAPQAEERRQQEGVLDYLLGDGS
jgi:ABC-type transporter Mla subunit MlaD